MAGFLLDAYALGVKDTFLFEIDGVQFDARMRQIDAVNGMAPVEPAYARKLLRDLVTWSASIGFSPHKDFSVIERIFGSVRADDCTEEFNFGYEGRPRVMLGSGADWGDLELDTDSLEFEEVTEGA